MVPVNDLHLLEPSPWGYHKATAGFSFLGTGTKAGSDTKDNTEMAAVCSQREANGPSSLIHNVAGADFEIRLPQVVRTNEEMASTHSHSSSYSEFKPTSPRPLPGEAISYISWSPIRKPCCVPSIDTSTTQACLLQESGLMLWSLNLLWELESILKTTSGTVGFLNPQVPYWKIQSIPTGSKLSVLNTEFLFSWSVFPKQWNNWCP